MTTNQSSRDEILRRVRNALHDQTNTPGTAQDAATLPRDYLTTHAHRTPAQTTQLLTENLTDYRATVHRTTTTGIPATIARLLTQHHTTRAITPPGLPPHWLTDITNIELLTATPEQTASELDTIDTVITGCALAIAETGTIILDASPDQGHRRITLIPDHHICIIQTPHQVVDSVPQAMPRLNPTRPQTWISGPSATSDIELDRVEGVHGPRTLDVIITEDSR